MNKLRSIIALITLILLTGCSHRPSNVLSDDKMVKLLVDMELAEAYTNTTSTSTSNQDRIELGLRVLKAHGVTEEQLDSSLSWYGKNIDEYAELFEKVDKEINKRRDKYMEIPGTKEKEADNLWPFSPHLVLSDLSGHDALTFTLPYPELEKGEILEITMSLPNPTGIKGTFGVEYSDGSGEALTSSFNSKNHLDMTLPTDTGKKVSKVFGIFQIKDKKSMPMYMDSIMIKGLPYDSLNYRTKRRSLKHFSGEL